MSMRSFHMSLCFILAIPAFADEVSQASSTPAPAAAAPTPAPAVADQKDKPKKYELIGASTSDLNLPASGGISFSIALGMNFLVAPGVQLGFASSLGYAESGSSSATAFSTLVGPVINLPAKLNVDNTLFIGAQAGVLTASSGSSSATAFIFKGTVGGRMRIVDGLNYRPNISVSVIQNSVVCNVNLMSFSFTY